MVRPNIYENLEKLSYGEIITAINNIKSKLNETQDKELHENMNNYYLALNQELDRRDMAKSMTSPYVYRPDNI